MPLSGAVAFKKAVNASRPPADAPKPTMGKGFAFTLAVVLRVPDFVAGVFFPVICDPRRSCGSSIPVSAALATL